MTKRLRQVLKEAAKVGVWLKRFQDFVSLVRIFERRLEYIDGGKDEVLEVD